MGAGVLAAVCSDNSGIMLADVPLPPCPPDGVLIDVILCGICGSDLLFASGARQASPYPLGHEYVGTIREMGRKVTPGFLVGERVCVDAVSHCGRCRYCRAGRTSLCVDRVFVPQAGPGGLAEVATAHASTLNRVPPQLSDATAALVEPFSVAVHAVRQLPGPVDRLLVVGAGSTGLAAVLCAKQLGVDTVHVTARHPHQVDAAIRCGATVLSPADVPHASYDHVLVTVLGDALDVAISLAARGASIVTTAGYSQPQTVSLRPLVSKELHVVGSICADKRDVEQVVRWLADGVVGGRALISHTFPLAEVGMAFATAADKSAGSIKVQVRVGWKEG
jgi:2-desacetyl-2-hydroxyethyl bacteriochlorophyllide A dehydrogenase